jgi:RHS repeat-associated protein
VQYKNPDEAGNLYETKDRRDRTYDKGGKLLKDKSWHYRYDGEGNLVLKSRRNINGTTKPAPLPQPKPAVLEVKRSGWLPPGMGGLPDQETDIQPLADGPAGVPYWQPGDWQYTWQANGMLKSVKRPDGKTVSFEYDALGRRTAKIYDGRITRFVWDGNVLLHEWRYDLTDRPKLVVNEKGQLEYDREEPVENLVTWVYEEGSYVPSAKLIDGERYSIVSDYIGRPIQAYAKDGTVIWSTEYDIYGRLRNLKGKKQFIPFRQLGQYEDEELSGLYYNRFRYYDSENGNYITQDPIGLAGNNPTLYAYVRDPNTWVDIFGLDNVITVIRVDTDFGTRNHYQLFYTDAEGVKRMTDCRYPYNQDDLKVEYHL